MQIFVKFCSDNTKVFDVFEGATINDVLKKYYNHKIWNHLYFVFNGKLLTNEEKIEDKFQHGCTLYIHLSHIVRKTSLKDY
jgi:hypothetical protein